MSSTEHATRPDTAPWIPGQAAANERTMHARIAQVIERCQAKQINDLRALREGLARRVGERPVVVWPATVDTPMDQTPAPPRQIVPADVASDSDASIGSSEPDRVTPRPEFLERLDPVEPGTVAHDARFFLRLSTLLVICIAVVLSIVLAQSGVAARNDHPGERRTAALTALPLRGATQPATRKTIYVPLLLSTTHTSQPSTGAPLPTGDP